MSTCQIITNIPVDLKIRLSNGHGEKIISAPNVFELLPGWQLLELIHDGSSTFEIDDLLIDGQSILENIYLAWYTDQQGNYHQPRNAVTTEPATWSIVLHSDISIFKERICSQLPNGVYGKNLFEEYQWFVDLGYPLKKSFSVQVDKFFIRPQGLNFYRKDDYHLYPYIPLNITIDNGSEIETELKNLTYNTVRPDGAKANPGWINSYLMLEDNPEKRCQRTDLITLPALRNWVASTGIVEFNHIVGLILPPGRAIEMHRDFMLHDKDLGPEDPNTTHNIYSLHINVTQNSQSKIKVAGGGVMPDGINILNNAGYVHAGINEGAADRYVITIKNPRPFNFIENFIVKSKIYFS
jgi:hypothetical protein